MTGRRMVPDAWNATDRPFRRRRAEAAVAEGSSWNPEQVALRAPGGRARTHAEMQCRVQSMAARLGEGAVAPDDFVAILSDHVPEAVEALLATLTVGGAYVPLDTRWPLARVVSVMNQARVTAALCDQAHLESVLSAAEDVPTLRTIMTIDDRSGWTLEAARELWDSIAEDPDEARAAGFNLREETVSPAGIDAYVERVTNLVLESCARRPRILDVGCGSGLLVRRLAGAASHYAAVEPSSVALSRAASAAADAGLAAELHCAYAHEIASCAKGPFDVVLLSSVVQFFPSHDYLLSVLEACRAVLAADGLVVVADLVAPAFGADRELLTVPPRLIAGVAVDAGYGECRVEQRSGVLAQEIPGRYDAILSGIATSDGDADRGRPLRIAAWQYDGPVSPPARSLTPRASAYCIFTSGSTGRPKGVLVSHEAVANLVSWVNDRLEVTAADMVLFVVSFAFDLSVYDMFGVMSRGGSIQTLPDAALRDPAEVAATLVTAPVTIWNSAPAALALVLPALEERDDVGHAVLRHALLSGDWVPLTMPGELHALLPRVRVHNLGGATEATVWSSSFEIEAVDPAWPSIPYGHPIQNTRYYVLDDDLEPCAIGEVGELYIAGVDLATGYLGDPRLTAARFLPDPWSGVPGGRMYRTGDRARWVQEGYVQFLGRLDDQVKVRGYRIELGDVQSAMERHPRVGQAAVVAVGPTHERELAAFYTSRDGLTPRELRDHLAEVLPEYMLPSRLHVCDVLPASDNDKVDRARLVALAEGRSGTSV